MKTVVALLLVCSITILAEDLTTKLNERRNPDGTLRWRLETISRGGKPVLRIHQSLKTGKTTTTRSFMVGGDVMMMETDEDGDGRFETVIVYHPPKNDLEVFAKAQDGSVKPVSSKTLAAYKKQHFAISEFFDSAFDKDMDADKFSEKVQETQRKIRGAEKEMKDEKK